MVNKFIGEVEDSLFGAGFTIRLDMDGSAKLETEFGEFDFVQKVQIGLAVLSAKYISAFLAVSLRDEKGALVKPEIPPEISLDVVARKCLDAFALIRYGKDHETWVADNEKKKVEAATASPENPTKGTKA